jgi:DNA-binding SARP family transcriptional activator/tetratricopeptide (TPR) repeat protein
MDLGLLGPVRAWSGAAALDLGTRRQRLVLAVLGLESNRLVPMARLVELCWPDQAPPSARRIVHAHVSRLRRILAGEEADIRRDGPGYLLRCRPELVDVHRFRALLDHARSLPDDAARGDEQRVAVLREAAGLWRGPALADVATDEVRDRLCHRLEEARLAAVEDRVSAELRLGRHAELVDELTGLVAEHPNRLRLVHDLVLALYRCGRTADALAACRAASRRLTEELGLDPGPQLHELELAVLRAEPALDPPPPAVVTTSRPRFPAQLPPDVRHFTGREAQLAALPGPDPGGVPVALVTGTAGVGKTALAVHWAHLVRDRFPDGQLYVDLRGYDAGPPLRPIDALARFLPALGVPAEQIPGDEDTAVALYRSLLADRRMLVVLDNAGRAAQVRPLVPGTPGSLVLVTSRDRLAGLVAHDGAQRIALDVLTPPEATALLVRLLGAARVRAEPAAAADLAAACAHLPLALRIAAANLADRPRDSIAGYVADLHGGDRLSALAADGDDRAAVREAFDLSYHALPAPERRLFRLLGLVPGPDVAVAGVAALADTPDVRQGLARLAAKHLAIEQEGGRYTLHDLLRVYARERAAARDGAPEQAAALARLLDWYLHSVLAAARLLYPEAVRLPVPPTGVRPADFATDEAALDWLDAERPNLVAAVQHAARYGPHPAAWLLADALRYYFIVRGYPVDWQTVARAALAAAEADAVADARAAAHLSLANSHHLRGDNEPAARHYRRALALAQRIGWVDCEAAAVNGLGTLFWSWGRPTEASGYLVRSLALDERTGRLVGQAVSHGNLGTLYHELGRVAEAADHNARALALHRTLGSRSGESNTLISMGVLAHHLGRPDEALGHIDAALAIQRDIGDRGGETDSLRLLAVVHADLGRFPTALEYAEAAVAQAQETGDRRGEIDATLALAVVHRGTGRYAEARDDLDRALAVARDAGERFGQMQVQAELAAVHEHLGRLDLAHRLADEAYRMAHRTGYRVLEGQALHRLAAVQLASGRPDRAAGLARQALDLQRATGHRLGQARTMRTLSEALRRTGDEPAARRYAERADAVFAEVRSPH